MVLLKIINLLIQNKKVPTKMIGTSKTNKQTQNQSYSFRYDIDSIMVLFYQLFSGILPLTPSKYFSKMAKSSLIDPVG